MNRVRIIHLEETASTNTDMKNLATQGAEEGTVLVAEVQTAGRGRLGRQFFSPRGTGCYMSILLRPDIPAEKLRLLTPMAAVAVCEAIEAVTDETALIKWVNDVFVGGKKVAGILTEGSFVSGRVDFAVVGIGVNLSEPQGGFPEELRSVAGTIGLKGKRDELVQEILRRFFSYYDKVESGEFIEAYRNRLFVLGQEVTVHTSKDAYSARAVDIDGMCGLIVEAGDGKRQVLSSGEISVRLP